MRQDELTTAARLDGVYGVLRKLQATHDGFQTACNGTGGCCKVGLRISLAECWNIARSLRRTYWIKAEDIGLRLTDEWWDTVIRKLKSGFEEPNWTWDNEDAVTKQCRFYNGGCTIYEYRPMVCRAYGVIAPVEENVCHRPRLEDGNIEIIWNEQTKALMDEFDAIIEDFGDNNPESDFSIYMPAGVLRFLLPIEELQDLIANTDARFWQATPGYQHRVRPENWETEVSIK